MVKFKQNNTHQFSSNKNIVNKSFPRVNIRPAGFADYTDDISTLDIYLHTSIKFT